MARHDGRAAVGALGLVTMGAMVGIIKDIQAGREPSYEVEDVVKNGISRSGVMGLQGEMMFGMWGALSDTGAYSRYAGMRGVDIVLGPSFGLLKDGMDLASVAASDEKEFSMKDLRTMIKFMPYNNLFYLKKHLKALTEDDDT
jgi:hypothetical protein